MIRASATQNFSCQPDYDKILLNKINKNKFWGEKKAFWEKVFQKHQSRGTLNFNSILSVDGLVMYSHLFWVGHLNNAMHNLRNSTQSKYLHVGIHLAI